MPHNGPITRGVEEELLDKEAAAAVVGNSVLPIVSMLRFARFYAISGENTTVYMDPLRYIVDETVKFLC